ncbi:hypothetical protein NDU88_002221 [Pleurodeles waltl]|uniref:Basic proline-rich protein-like n=1 Tax=Pleurodeles waltl TaxID=8319 RepID=A0AAV7TL74_PLEWA|nr:hypothetical protein NDU88_002221 [Pleurodeles waltl]
MSTRTRAAPLRHSTPTDHQSRYNLTRGPELHLQSNSLVVCSRDALSPRRRVAPALSLGLTPSPIISAPQDVSTVGPSGPNRQPRRSGGIPLASPAVLGPIAPEPPRSADPPGDTTPIAGRPPCSPGAARLRESCLAAPRLGAATLGLSGPFRHFRCRGGIRPGSPAAPLRLPSHRAGSRPQPATPPQLGGLLWRPPLSSGRPPPSRLGPQPHPGPRPRSRAGSRILLGPPASRSAASLYPDWAQPLSGPFRHFRSRWGGARPGSSTAPLPPPSRRVGSRPDARPRPRPRAQASGSRAHQRADFAPRHSPGSPRGPTLARPLPPAQPLRSDLDRPGEGALSGVFSLAPPEREIQACAISGSLATPLTARP